MALGLLFILLWLWLLRSSKVDAKRNYLFEKLLRLIRSSAVMHKTDESEWNKLKKGRRVVSWKSSLVGHQNLAVFRMLCIFRGKKQKWPRFFWNVLGLLWRWYWASNIFSKFQCWSFGALYQDTIGQDRPYWILARREICVLSIFLERYDKISLWTFKEFIIFMSFEIPLWLLDFFVAVKTVGVDRSSLLYSRGCFNPRVHLNSQGTSVVYIFQNHNTVI